jgi:phytoene synthase
MDRIETAYRWCADQVRQAGSSFYYGMRFLPPQKRSAIYAIYAWSRLCDDAVDNFHGDEARQKLLTAESVYHSALAREWQHAANPITVALGDAIRRFKLKPEAFMALIEGMRMDLECTAYRTFQELERYCLNVAGSVGTLCVDVFGTQNVEASDLAGKLGVALQLTNILRDLKEDSLRGRCYIPEEDFEAVGLNRDSTNLTQFSPPVVRLVALEVRRAESYFHVAQPLVEMVEADSVRGLKLLYGVYYLLLQKIKRGGFNVWDARVRVTRREALHVAGETFWHANA